MLLPWFGMQNFTFAGPTISSSTDLTTRSAERLEQQIRAVRNSRVSDSPGELKKAAQQFESLFICYLLKVMRETIEESGLTEGGFGKSIYTELFDDELSKSIAQRGALGIADLLINRLGPQETSGAAPAPANNDSEPASPKAVPPTHLENGERAAPTDAEIPDFHLPVNAPISSAYGIRRDPFTGLKRFHKGVDLAAPVGTQILAPWGGKVISAGLDAGYGNSVVVEHPEGFQTRYAHLGSSSVRVGDMVIAGEVLGTVGSSGRSTGAHLHFEVIRNGKRMDPTTALAE